MNKIEKAIILATEVHAGQVDKGSNPYIFHSLRVMCAVEKWTRNFDSTLYENMLCAAVLHDVIEDAGDANMAMKICAEIEDKIGVIVYHIVDCLTRCENESWKNYINRVKNNNEATTIKIADLEDNCDLTRLYGPELKDYRRKEMYERAIKYLETGEGKL